MSSLHFSTGADYSGMGSFQGAVTLTNGNLTAHIHPVYFSRNARNMPGAFDSLAQFPAKRSGSVSAEGGGTGGREMEGEWRRADSHLRISGNRAIEASIKNIIESTACSSFYVHSVTRHWLCQTFKMFEKFNLFACQAISSNDATGWDGRFTPFQSISRYSTILHILRGWYLL